MSHVLSRFIKDESGATAIEYGLIAALIGIALIAGAQPLGLRLAATFNNVSSNLPQAAAGR